ncbi:MAG TPA: hypothetical protein VLW17_05905 [Thermoanaerobaculaceae bacterium]|nr:hypothetical protein [Thermoanaerobaculaceae bacterium]
MRRFACHSALLATALLGSAASAAEKQPYSWPPLPSPEQVAKAMARKSVSGFVILDWQCKLEIRSLIAKPEGTTREDFIRYLIVSDEAARKATITVNDDPAAKIAYVEGRTVAPGGAVTAVDEKRDIKRIDLTNLRRHGLTASLAEVAFPAPAKGAILDLHFSTTREGTVYFYVQPLVQTNTPSLNADLELTIKGGVGKVPWSALTVGDSDGVVSLEYLSNGGIKVHVAPFTPPRGLPFDPPAHQLYPTLVCSIDLASWRLKGDDKGALFHSATDIDSRGRVASVAFPSQRHREFWGKFLAELAKADKEFLARPGAAFDIDVKAIAPPELPVEERAARLYRAAQEHCGYNPDEESPTSLSAMMRRGMVYRWQGTLLYSYLLGRAGIAHRVGVVADRYSLRFTPIVRNEYLFGFDKVVAIERQGLPPLYAMPGYLGLPFGTLPEFYQDSLVFFALGENDLEYNHTGLDQPGLDTVVTSYDLELDGSGDATGKVALKETGAPALYFYRWNKYRLYRAAHPTKEDKSASASAEKQKKDEYDRTLGDEFELPGDKLQLMNYTLPSGDIKPSQAVEVGAAAFAKGLAMPAQGKWLLYANAALAGFASPFGDDVRMTPIWYAKSGHFVVEGETKLPAGARVVELPQPAEIAGPDGVKAVAKVDAIERDGRTFVHSRVEYDLPLVVGSDKDAAWRRFQTEIARIAQDRCIISMPAKKELE